MFKRILLTKPLVNFKISTWEISNFLSGFFLAKICAVKLSINSNHDNVKSLCAYILEFGSPVLIVVSCVILQIYFTTNKLKTNDEFSVDKSIKRSIEVRESLIYTGVCFIVGFALYIGFIVILSQYIISVEQLKFIVNGILPFEFTLAVCMSLVWGNIIKFTTHYKL